MTERESLFSLACGCEGEGDCDAGYRVVYARNFLCNHKPGDPVSVAENERLRQVNAEWDRAEREYLEQP